MREDEKTPFDDEFIRKRLKTKMRASALIYVFSAIFILGLVLLIVSVVTNGMNVLTFIQLIVLIACALVPPSAATALSSFFTSPAAMPRR